MFLSVFAIYKIGIGPSSSHTVGPMLAARRFLNETDFPETVKRLRVNLYGSLSFTGKGHGTDRALALGLAGEVPDKTDPDKSDMILQSLARRKEIKNQRGRVFIFDPQQDIIFNYGPALPEHPNGMVFTGKSITDETIISEKFFSIGGGFVQNEQEFKESLQKNQHERGQNAVPFPFKNIKQMLEMGKTQGLSIAEMKRANEEACISPAALEQGLDHIWSVMRGCIERGLNQQGILPGGLKVKRRAADIYARLQKELNHNTQYPHRVMDYLSAYAMAVNEENAAGGRVVTAPTNGAAGIIPAVIRYYEEHCQGASRQGVHDFLLVSAAIGGVIKHNASISGAEVGCQGEVGSASAMAAAGLCAALGGSNTQIENAAEIALEHHLGMTCDPVAGLVQVPCIERNGLGAVKAVTAASLALHGNGEHFMPLDNCIETMRQTGMDMGTRYKETSTGGLAVNIVEC